MKFLPTINLVLGLILSYFTLAFLSRIILTWYPQINISKGFWCLLSWPTEPVLQLTRKFVSPIGGVDVTPVIWVGLISLIRELLVGPQGLLSQIVSKSTYLS